MRRITLLGIIPLIPFLLVTLLNRCATAGEGSIVLPSYSWNTPQATVLADGNLQWAPQPFAFEKGTSLRYIDFAGGDDSRDGTSPATAWQHHPWDREATGRAKAGAGLHTYLFKGGVVYRGELIASESGNSDNPIRLTWDPSWGSGKPLFHGSTTIVGGWQRANAAEAPGMPRPESVWFIDLDKNFDPDPGPSRFTAIWQSNGDQVERLHLARTPDYDFSEQNNPVKNWPVWARIEVEKSTFHHPIIRELRGASAKELEDAVIWSESPSLMGAAYPRSMADASWDTQAGSVQTKAFGNADTFKRMRRWNHFMIENVANLLDSPGEFFYARRGPHAGRLYLWPVGDVDPNTVRYEVAQTRTLITIANQSNIVISGLEFRYNDADDGPSRDNTRHNTKPGPCILVIGDCANITVNNNTFYHVVDAVEARLRRVGEGGSKGQVMDNIIISDNDIAHASGAGVIAILGADFHAIHPEKTEYGDLRHVEVLRNRLFHTGFRGALARWDSLPAISVSYPETCEIAGNIVDTSFGIGIITFGGKASGHQRRTVGLTRYLIHHNQLDNTLLNVNDYGGLEHFQGGPVYLYNNVSRNAVGNRSFWGQQLGYNLYLDGGFKSYAFNNILAGEVKPDDPQYSSHCGYFMVFGFLNQFFNNTLYRFDYGLHGSSGNRSNVLGNLLSDFSKSFISQNRPGDHSMLGGGDSGEMGRIGIPTMAYSSNLFHGKPKQFGEVAGVQISGQRRQDIPVVAGKTLKKLRESLTAQQCRLADLGWQVDDSPLTDPARRDYRPVASTDNKGRGVKYFVPWALAGTVGEWNFFKHPTSPDIVLGEHFYMTEEYARRDQYYYLPRNDLTVSRPLTAADYLSGPLEDWIEGALAFDGRRTATLTHAEMTRNVAYPAAGKQPAFSYDGSRRETVDMGGNDFILELYFRTAAGHSGGTLVAKSGHSSGYALAIGADGRPQLTLRAEGGEATTATASAMVNAGAWHHLLVEVDRAAGRVSFFIDGQAAGQSGLGGLGRDAELSNTSDFVVGKGLVGAIDFLRVCRSTLAESKTTIDELYAWQFHGPMLRDFTGRGAPAAGLSRNAGALLGIP